MNLGNPDQNIKRYKILLVGNSGVGKTSIMKRFVFGKFDSNISMTVNAEFRTIMYDFKSQKYRLQLWDIAGQDKYFSLSKLYVRGAHGIIVVCDTSDEESVMGAGRWHITLDEYCQQTEGRSIPFILVQNKFDLV